MTSPEALLPHPVYEISQHLLVNVGFLSEVRELIKERAALEREYGSKLELLVKKFKLKKDKKGPGLTLGTVCATSLESDLVSKEISSSTLNKALDVISQQWLDMAQSRQALSENLVGQVEESFKTLAYRTEEARKKHLQFANKILFERDRIFAEKDKARSHYEEAYNEMEQCKLRLERATDEKSREKVRKELLQDTIDADNLKNLYVLSLRVCNDHQRKYQENDVKELTKHMMDLNESRLAQMSSILAGWIGLEKETIDSNKDQLKQMKEHVEAISPSKDAELLLKHCKISDPEIVAFPYQGCHAEDTNDTLVTKQDAKNCLHNHLHRTNNKLQVLNKEIESKKKELEGLTTLEEAYRKNVNHGDAYQVHENFLDVCRLLTLLNTTARIYQTEAEAIVSAVGELPTTFSPHDFRPASFTIPTACDHCGNTLWGIVRQGFTCKECGFNCHAKCEFKVISDCTKIPGGARLAKEKAAKAAAAAIPQITTTRRRRLKGDTLRSTNPNTSRLGIPSAFLINTPSNNENKDGSMAIRGSVLRHTILTDDWHVGGGGGAPPTIICTASVLYDYTARTDAEISVNAGGVVNIIEMDDGSGWIRAELNGLEGLIPAAYVKLNQGAILEAGHENEQHEGDEEEEEEEAEEGEYVQALYDYQARSELELSIYAGAVILITSKECSEGWWEGMLDGQVGQFPITYVMPFEPSLKGEE